MREISIADQIATNVRVEMAKQKIRVKELAVEIHMAPASLSHRLNGRTDFSPYEIECIADALQIDPNELLAVTGRSAGNSGPNSVSPAPAGESGSRERMDRPAARDLGESA